MGSQPSKKPDPQPIITKQSKLKKTTLSKALTISLEQPVPPPIIKVAQKMIDIPQNLNKQHQNIYRQAKEHLFDSFKTRFLAKVSRKEVRLLFKSKASNIQDNSSGASHFSDRSIIRLQRKSELDYLIYAEVLQVRWKCIFAQQIKKVNEQSRKEEGMSLFRTKIEVAFAEAITILLAEIQGKTTTWCSLNLSPQQKQIKIINFLHQQGIHSEKFDFVGQAQCYCQS